MYLKEFQAPHALLYGVYTYDLQDRKLGFIKIKSFT